MKNDHPGVQPDGDGSKCPSANDIGRRPTAARAEREINITLVGYQKSVSNAATPKGYGIYSLPMMPTMVQYAESN